MMNGEKLTRYDDSVVFFNTGKSFTLRGDLLKKKNVYKLITTDSADAKTIISFLFEKFFEPFTRGESTGFQKIYTNLLF